MQHSVGFSEIHALDCLQVSLVKGLSGRDGEDVWLIVGFRRGVRSGKSKATGWYSLKALNHAPDRFLPPQSTARVLCTVKEFGSFW